MIIDEAGGVPKSIFDAVDALATNIDVRVVAVGNPDDPASHFATICKPGSGWEVQQIRSTDTPESTGEQVPDELRVLFAWAILDETPSALQLAGVGLVVCGLLIVTWGSRPRRAAAESGYVPAGPRESLGS